jgi:hypothetical protein
VRGEQRGKEGDSETVAVLSRQVRERREEEAT